LAGKEHPPTEPLRAQREIKKCALPAMLKKLAHLGPERNRQKTASLEGCCRLYGSVQQRRATPGTSHKAGDPFQLVPYPKGIPSKGNRKFSQRGVAGCGRLPAVTGHGQVKMVLCFKGRLPPNPT
jgi:hypothetical protein